MSEVGMLKEQFMILIQFNVLSDSVTCSSSCLSNVCTLVFVHRPGFGNGGGKKNKDRDVHYSSQSTHCLRRGVM